MKTPLRPEENLFHEAMAIADPARRAAFLQQACSQDPALRQRVEALLHAAATTRDFLEGPPRAVSADATEVLPKTPRAASGTPASAPSEKPGDCIGHYKLLERIGEGGCGVVYMADQVEPIRRRVALKVVKLGMDTREVIARFEAERQALALMDHPNIAKVLDAGATHTGRPYFVMELVRGIPITEYCDQNNVPTVERLGLFAQVCRAIQHAHQKGIIHRDLKPSNILVTLHDGTPVPKVIDFGIAKATAQQQLTDKTLFTAFRQFIGTPAYMSPEQAEMSGLDIDTRSDLYSLGVLLYELLTGQPPFDQKQLLKAGFDEMRRLIREQEPPKPSTCLSTLAAADLTTVAKHRAAEAPKLVSLMRGDLDWIVMKCLEKDRTRRYESADALAQDLERHLHHEPVAAAAPGALYRTRKFARRHRAGIAVATTFVALLIAGVVVSTWQAVRATRAERRIRMEAMKSEVAAMFMTDMWQGLKPLLPKQADMGPVIEILNRTTAAAAEKLRGNPEASVDLMELASGTYVELGLEEQGNQLFRAALEEQKQQSGANSLAVASLLNNRGYLLSQRKRYAEAQKLLEEAWAIARKYPSSNHSLQDSVLWNLTTAICAQTNLTEAANITTEWAAANPENFQALYQAGNYLGRQGEWAAAADLLGKCIKLAPAEHVPLVYHTVLLLQIGDMEGYQHDSLAALDRFAAGNDTFVSDRALRCYLLTPGSGTNLDRVCRQAETNLAANAGQRNEAFYQFTLGLANLRRGRPAEALELVKPMVAQPMVKNSTIHLYARDVSGYMVMAMALQQLNRTEEARAALAQGLELASQKLPATDSHDWGEHWWGALMAQVHIREARTMIEKTPQ